MKSTVSSRLLPTRYLGLVATTLLLGFVAAVYVLRPGDRSPGFLPESARLAGAPHFRVISDPLELAQVSRGTGPVVGVVATDGPVASQRGSSEPESATATSNAESESVSAAGTSAAPDMPASMGLSPGADRVEPDPAIQEFKDMGMAMVSGPGANWYTLQTAYVPAEDVNLLKRRILEASNALGSRDDLFLYTAQRSGRTYYGVCVRRFESGSLAKAAKGKLDARLGYKSQLRSKQGLQKEMGL